MIKPLTITQIIEAFPEECKEIIPKVSRVLKKHLNPYLTHVKSIRNRHHSLKIESFLLKVIKIYYDSDQYIRLIKQNKAILGCLNGPQDGKINDAMVETAKSVPLNTLYDFENIKSGNARFTARCPFHTEKSGSFTAYPNNTYYCFSCHSGGDSIEFIRKLNGFGFIDAVKFLLKQ